MGGILELPCVTPGDRDSMTRLQSIQSHHEQIQAEDCRAVDPALQDGAGLSQYSYPRGMIRAAVQ